MIVLLCFLLTLFASPFSTRDTDVMVAVAAYDRMGGTQDD